MKKLPEYLPEYKIEKTNLAPFRVKCEELMGFCIVPKLNEKITWGSYDYQSRKMTDYTTASVIGKAEIHGVEGVEILAKQHDCNSGTTTERFFVAQLTDTHCRYLAESHIENGVRKYFTFLDSDVFMNNWGFGDDNCGYEINLSPRGMIKREDDKITVARKEELIDITGRYHVRFCSSNSHKKRSPQGNNQKNGQKTAHAPFNLHEEIFSKHVFLLFHSFSPI